MIGLARALQLLGFWWLCLLCVAFLIIDFMVLWSFSLFFRYVLFYLSVRFSRFCDINRGLGSGVGDQGTQVTE